ncbi:pilus assembly protein TadG-related protein [uncultured Microbacterium sp.]|uniref:pilus assembly protein TadG-related protein n=1 Tax=uncultured Microbacterium sp. TaxID=191216 RepID=UPI0035CC30A3
MIAIVRRFRARVAAGSIAADDEGSILLLTIGYAVLALAAVLICVDATSLYLEQKRLDSLADAAALAGADGFTIAMDAAGQPRADLTDTGVQAQAAALVEDAGSGAVLVSAATPDGVSARVTVATTWHPPVITLFVPGGVPLEATATSRTALR